MRIDFPRDLRGRLRQAVRRAGRNETGGILMAAQIEPGHFRLVEFTVDSQTGSAAHFVRSVEHHQSALSEFFARTGSEFGRFNYLGEWHSHPNHVPIPSREDVGSMQSLVHGERDIPFAVLLVVRSRWSGLMLTVTLFQRDQEPTSVMICDG